ncbi:MAG: ornithine decarboxylase [Parcubacteria group bacterium Gr01-1014_38]|nr:MAG: ornithine decarboxylase [Parcubacteria group bacterium Gr01-1014_38]
MSAALHAEFDRSLLEKLEYATPFFLFSRKRVTGKFQEFQKYFPGSLIHYAMKANAESGLLQTLFDAGSGFEVASIHELNMLKEVGVPPEKMIYGTSVKPSSHIKEFFDYGVDRFAFDSLPELEKIAAVAPKSRVYVRVIVNDTGSVFRFSEKFGTDRENIVPLLQRAKALELHPYGISFHVGSQASNPLAWAAALESLQPALEHLKKLKIKLDIIDIGGGYPCAYASTEEELSLEEIARHTLDQYQKLPYQPQLLLEPGRGIAATTAIVVTTVISRVERKSGTWLFLDAGVYNALFETMAYQGSTRYKVTSLRPSYDAGEMLFALAGPTGDSPDIITHEALLPQDLAVGDKLILHDVGAYSLVTASRFNGFPKPDVYFV